MYSTKSSQPAGKRHSGPHFSTHPASSPGPRHVTRSPDYPHELPSPSKRPRLASTPSSASLPSTPTRDRDTFDFYQARFESAMRLKGSWARLAQRYARPLEEDDIIDLREAKILKDRGVVRGLHSQVSFGGISLLDEPGNDASSDADGAHSEDEDDFDEIDSIPREARVSNRLEAQLRRVKPLRDLDSDDDDDLKEFLEAERRTREEFGPVDEEVDEDFSEDLAQLQDDVEDEIGDLAEEVIEIFESSDEESEHQDFSRTLTTRTREDSESEEDELGRWVHDESTAIYEVARARTPTAPDDEVIEIFDTPPSSPPPSLPPSSPSPMSDPPPRRLFTRASSP